MLDFDFFFSSHWPISYYAAGIFSSLTSNQSVFYLSQRNCFLQEILKLLALVSLATPASQIFFWLLKRNLTKSLITTTGIVEGNESAHIASEKGSGNRKILRPGEMEVWCVKKNIDLHYFHLSGNCCQDCQEIFEEDYLISQTFVSSTQPKCSYAWLNQYGV
jgi:hypothetical protein